MTAPSSKGSGTDDTPSQGEGPPVTISIDKPKVPPAGRRRRIAPKKPVSPFKKWASLLVLTALIYTLVGFFAAPVFITSFLSSQLEKKINRPVTIGSAKVNPFRFDIILKNGIIGAEKDNPDDQVDPLFSFGRLKIKLQPKALFTDQPIFRAIHGNSVFLHLVRDKSQTLNLQSLLAQTTDNENLNLKSITDNLKQIDLKLSDAKILFDDQTSNTNHIIDQISLRLPSAENSTASHHFSASINGSPIEFGAFSKQNSSGQQSFTLDLKDIDLLAYLSYLPAPFPTLINRGRADLDMSITSSYDGASFNLNIEGTGVARDIWVNDGKENHNKIDSATFTFSGNMQDRRIIFHKLVLEKPELHVNRNKEGLFFFPARDSFTSATMSQNLLIETIIIKNGKLVFIDQNIPGGFGASFNDVNLSIDKNPGDANSSYALNCITSRKTRIASQGTISPENWQIKGLFILNNLPLAALNSYLTRENGLSINSGLVDKFETSFMLSPRDSIKITSLSDTTLSVKNLGLSSQGKEFITLPTAKLAGGSFSRKSRTVGLGNLVIDGGRYNLTPDSPFPLPEYQAGKQQLLWKISTLSLNKNMVHLRGFKLQKKPQTVVIKKLSATNISTDPKTTSKCSAEITMLRSASAKLSGTLQLNPFRSVLDTQLDNISLNNIPEPLLKWLKPSLLGGSLSAKGILTFPELSFKGSTQVKRLKLRFGKQRELLSIKKLDVKNGVFNLTPPKIRVKQVIINEMTTGVLITKKKLFDPDDFFPKVDKDQQQTRLTINSVVFKNSHFSFRDPSQTPPFAYTIDQTNGTMDSIDTGSAQSTTLQFTGHGEDQAQFTLAGSCTLFTDDFGADLKIHLMDFPLTTLNEFVEPISGYGIQGGLFNLQVNYQESQGVMVGDTSLDIRHLTLTGEDKGNKQFPDVVALLTGADHHIKLALPITGNTTDPSYTFQSAYAKKLREFTLATMVSPYSVLGDYFNQQQPPPNQIIFIPGSTEIDTEQKDVLLSLQTIIKNRPLLHLTLAGYSGSKEDRQTLLAIKQAQRAKKDQENAIAAGGSVAKTYGQELITPPTGQGPTVLPPKTIRITKQELQALAMERSKQVKTILVQEYGISPDILHIDTTPTVLPQSDTGIQGHRVKCILSGSAP